MNTVSTEYLQQFLDVHYLIIFVVSVYDCLFLCFISFRSMYSLERAKIGVAGAKALAACLKCNRTLTGLSLSRNSIGLEGALAFAQALKVNSKLSWLNLQNNNLPSEGKRKLRSAQRASFQLDM
eukprot:m.66147 g.66147  ORF g.66147 m.66147 type:complete len:124 (+) comp12103_c0_seq3:29-400(+)